MPAYWEHLLARWRSAGLIDDGAATRIRDYEFERRRGAGMRWPVAAALGLGALMMGAGVLLFVAAHWDQLRPAYRFGLTLALVGVFHTAGAFASERFPAFAVTMHALGTVAFGAGVFLAGQIFNLSEHWPGGIMLWAAGAWIGWAILRDLPQAGYVALLTPVWLVSEWGVAVDKFNPTESWRQPSVFLLVLALTYLSTSRVLAWMGALAILPIAAGVAYIKLTLRWSPENPVPQWLMLAGWVVALLAPLALAGIVRGKSAWMNFASLGWAVGLVWLPRDQGLPVYVWCALGAVGLIAWGLAESRTLQINIGVAGFALVVLVYYFSTVMDKLGRSASLIGLGVLFIAGGWMLERLRRRLVAQVVRA